MPGPALRSNIVEVYAWRGEPTGQGLAFLQLHRAKGALARTWQPVMGHINQGESAVEAALRELAQETGYAPRRGLLALWQLELVNTYLLARDDCVMMSPGFAVQVDPAVEPVLDADHDAWRWVAVDEVERSFLWPGQRAAIAHILRDIAPPGTAAGAHLRVDISAPG